MRLIDAEAFKQQIAAVTVMNGYQAESANKMCEIIDNQPTAYDVDKVVEQLEVNSMFLQEGIEAYVMLEDAVDIVKSGGGINVKVG